MKQMIYETLFDFIDGDTIITNTDSYHVNEEDAIARADDIYLHNDADKVKSVEVIGRVIGAHADDFDEEEFGYNLWVWNRDKRIYHRDDDRCKYNDNYYDIDFKQTFAELQEELQCALEAEYADDFINDEQLFNERG